MHRIEQPGQRLRTTAAVPKPVGYERKFSHAS
jgi:hypothetical protein